jgi:hypothetical protein
MRDAGNAVVPVLGIVLGLVIVGGVVGVILSRSTDDGGRRDPVTPELERMSVIPSMDLSAPTDTETATFALG